QRHEPMMEDVQEVDERRIFLVTPPLVRVLGEMNRQRAVRPEETERILFEAHLPAGLALESRDIRWRERQVRRVAEPNPVVRCLARLAEPRLCRQRLLQQPQRCEQREAVRLRGEPRERAQIAWRRPNRTGHVLISPRAAESRRVCVKELMDTY